ncbi:DUF488 family protein [Corynebacterium sp. 320]|uniref:DUF488 domain-containing protein n=1 Tax=Corynebacterium TaxID=1716 RepID=UPI00125CD2B5|nr:MULTISPECIES: DUF488 family protein [Corynebacterium]KAB1502717.1 DUF488 family protein [Corynebacterium sp. 320]KAB1550545.1 DUF488 family protein [Corynebacterium sp. 319]KAB1554728.1 DUF488 family protein [Corynebacterium sp. 321]KAB3526380.1 DUF488 family protein [Corynebacterium sp. 250]KAB3537775.1 DUF488 family protein [Corynebacterium sp. 366]
MSVDRVYNVRDEQDSAKVYFLVDRLWPRGVKKESLYLGFDGDDAGWLKELTPSSELRKRFHAESGGIDFEEFTGLYLQELEDAQSTGELDSAVELVRRAVRGGGQGGQGDVVLLTANKDESENHADVLRTWLEEQL